MDRCLDAPSKVVSVSSKSRFNEQTLQELNLIEL